MATTTFRSKVNAPKGVGALNASISDSDLTITLQAGQGAEYDASNFTISIDDEVILIDSRSTDTLAVNASGRGYDGTTAAGHDAGAAVYQYQIAKDFTDLEDAINAIEDGTAQLEGLDTDQTTVPVFNDTATTVNAFGAATTINMGASGGTNDNCSLHGMDCGAVSGSATARGIRYGALDNASYMIMQTSAGITNINAKTGQYISFNVNSTAVMQMAATYLAFVDGKNIQVGTTTGTKLGTATTQKLGFWNVTPVIQPASANQAALTNSTGGSGDGTLASISGSGADADINNNFTELHVLLDAIRTALVDVGLMKGAA